MSEKDTYEDGYKYTVDELYNETQLRRSSKNQVARNAEKAFDLGDCLYFYAGYACPRFGNIVFVFEASITDGRSGNAGDFDSGGLQRELIHFSNRPHDVVDWAKKHTWDLADWPRRCEHHVTTYWGGDWAKFVRGDWANTDDAEGRLLHSNNKREAWSVEVRLHNDHNITDGLLRIAIPEASLISIRGQIRRDRDTDRRKRWEQRMSQRVVVSYDQRMHEQVMEDIAEGTL